VAVLNVRARFSASVSLWFNRLEVAAFRLLALVCLHTRQRETIFSFALEFSTWIFALKGESKKVMALRATKGD